MKLHFYHTKSRGIKNISQIKILIEEAAKKVGRFFPVDSIDIIFVSGKTPLVVTGNSFYDNTLMFIIDQSFDWKEIKKNIQPTFYHEIQHLARIKTVGYGNTLEEAIVTEGLAIAIEEEMGGTITQWKKFKNKKEFYKVYNRFVKERKNKSYDHENWFFGGDKMPKCSGYKLGYIMVSKYCVRYDKKPSEIFDIKAHEILKDFSREFIKP